MRKTVRAYAPGNISLLFKVIPNKNPLKMTAAGSGFTVNEGATVSITQAAQAAISYNGERVLFPTVNEVVKNMTTETLSIKIVSRLPLGSGFGMSGAAAIASAYAINELFKLKKTPLDLVKIAHWAEVVHKTGLGDVGNQQYGGCCVKFVNSSLFQMQRLPFTGTTVWAKSWGKIPTPSILSNKNLLVNIDQAGDEVLATLKKRIRDPLFSFAELLDISNTFTGKSGLVSSAPHAQKIIQEITSAGGHAAMIILGDAVVSDTPFEESIKLTISEQGVSMVRE